MLVNPVATDKPTEMPLAAGQFVGNVLYIHDQDGSLANACGALTTTDVIVLDRSRTIVYHGAIDDQYGFGYSIDAPRYRYLADALAAIQAGESPLVAATETPGCTLERPGEDLANSNVTYHNQIANIMQRHCVECHRESGVGLFPLDTFDDVVAHTGMIKQAIERGIMPPCFAVDTFNPQPQARTSNAETDGKNISLARGYGLNEQAKSEVQTPWANDRSPTAAERGGF